MQDRFYSDEELVAYLDGEDDFAPVAEIEAALSQDPALQARLDALSVDRDVIGQSFAQLLPKESVMPDYAEHARPLRRFGARSLIAASIVSLAVGLGFGLGLNSPAEKGWTDYVAAYQALYSNSTIAHIPVDVAAQTVELERVSSAIGKSISLQTVTAFPEVEYKRAQILSYEGQALAQLVFETSTGAPLALCIIRANAQADSALASMEIEGMQSAHWGLNGYEYLLIGGKDQGLIDRIATSLVRAEI